jgi:hypothetical protein
MGMGGALMRSTDQSMSILQFRIDRRCGNIRPHPISVVAVRAATG